MANKLIEYKEKNFNDSVIVLNKVVKEINKIIPILMENGHTDISVNFFRGFCTDFYETLNEYFKIHLTEVCDFFGKPIFEYNQFYDETIRNMTYKRVYYLKEARTMIKTTTKNYEYIFDEKYIDIIENKLVIKPNAEKLLKDYFSIYTDSDKQDKAVAPLQTIAKELEKLKKQGINLQLVLNDFLFYLSDNEVKINSKYFKSYIAR